MIFKQDTQNLKHIYDQHVGSDMDFKTFLKLCDRCWEDKYSFLVIDCESDVRNGKYRKNFNYFVHL